MNQESPSSKRALLIINPHARQGRDRKHDIISQLQQLGFILLSESTENPRQLSEIIRRYRNQVDLVIIGGGDGTLNAAVEGLIDTQLPLAILPLGTANDLARTLKIPTSIPGACQVIATGKLHKIDLGWVNGKYFFNVASCGLSVQITQRLTKEAKRRWGVFAYAAVALQVIWQARLFKAEIRQGNESILVKTIQIAVGNGRHYGGGMTVVHDATIDDCRLDLYSLEIRHWWQILAILPALWQGRQATLPGVRAIEGTEIEIYTRKPLPINTDGEITTQTPAKFRVIPQAISVLVPAQD
ncbi:MAG TPA: lipid kinase [Cyanobacteria bacterium UBA11149]|nr:lipid kinase [Cyanobacteria bacterium UBA11367]HBE59933.1 lipid kinase [Cyanobacteria bacterium UBA11366]HBK64685.1 lipid kinase [Cyanobacteria bacterium UBA11166]HBR75889.1 lipid kinase [Cyanobacteria bacterium UBA11159]HBS69311.1 lipid kinase [Cyanobacteria bacterium UBA11153]HBW89713.1 lipid kinase [Cyanobacteria bacterium UBA11149]HCA93866.1 lipid kinase [Cyanobacteria bacterium UBA9226]